ncbi:mediator of RNA polymerase II transcription subunit 15a-like isoform X2 [Olea europaea subsp. europaea]|uniref:Mediator of RNA polymerase II transcription subunit 15a-like isoform X2 n=1 Tax=Olea europaea subsp. europaea TaxID=158383 RepID=A0A8S0PK42_OLEEU|nr:mediator of RNA polymerase II transcription subunit 15a-like isoform X2 [Olea europaea subsp. europaea]
MDTLKRHLLFSGEEGIQEHRKIAVRFEEKTYIAAASQSDYLRRISSGMLKLERESQNHPANSYPFNAASYNKNPQYPAEGDWKTQLPADSRQRIVLEVETNFDFTS